MPHFSFTGITLQGTTIKNMRTAHSVDQLREDLLKENIALISCSEKKSSTDILKKLFQQRVGTLDCAMFFQYLSSLLLRGVPLTNALQLFEQQVTNKTFTTIVHAIHQQITKGSSLGTALRDHQSHFSPFIIQLIESGEKTGTLGTVLANAAKYLQDRHEFKKNLMRSALFPIITLSFSLLIFIIIFIFIVPQFEALFSSAEKAIPTSTQKIIWLSHLLQSKWAFIFLCTIPLQCIALRLASKITRVRKTGEWLLLNLPGIGPCYQKALLMAFLKSFHLFIKTGFTVKQAFEHAQLAVKSHEMQQALQHTINALNQGSSLTGALQHYASPFFDSNTIGLISIGEQSGNLETMLAQSIDLLEYRFKDKLLFLSSTLQPILLIVIGILITGILVITYLPIFSLATSLH